MFLLKSAMEASAGQMMEDSGIHTDQMMPLHRSISFSFNIAHLEKIYFILLLNPPLRNITDKVERSLSTSSLEERDSNIKNI